MARETNINICLILPVFLAITNMMQQHVHGEPQVPCLFIFGDSLSDSGNNNLLWSDAKVNYPPYGIDFPNGIPTGRFCNGKTIIDIITEHLGFDHLIPPFPKAKLADILQGVNYASGGCGIRDETGLNVGGCISFSRQLIHHRVTIWRITKMLGNPWLVMQHLHKCLYFVSIGSNDYLNNYYVPDYYQTSRLYTPEQYADVLIQQYSQKIKTLYKFGARKFALVGIGEIGCTPHSISSQGTHGSICVHKMNKAVKLFDDKLKPLVDQFKNDLPGAHFSFVGVTGLSILKNPTYNDFNILKGCCPVRDDGQCIPGETPCKHRDIHAFWDSFHPTEAINKIVGTIAFNASDALATYPMDISQLAKL